MPDDYSQPPVTIPTVGLSGASRGVHVHAVVSLEGLKKVCKFPPKLCLSHCMHQLIYNCTI